MSRQIDPKAEPYRCPVVKLVAFDDMKNAGDKIAYMRCDNIRGHLGDHRLTFPDGGRQFFAEGD